jgi:F0F1-type ATP synthase membrane subunit c/vacuolar-type H+-ATPase subunit K
VCGKKFGIVDLVSQPPVCLDCEKVGAKAPSDILRNEEAKTDRITGMMIIVGAIAFTVILILVPSRDGASPSGKLRLFALVLSALAVGLGMFGAANRRLRKKKK